MRLSRFKIYKMYKRSRFGRQGGFSLVELMVVVAIIGILAAIAIPNYQRFQRKARQSEAKILSSGIYNALKMFISEHGFGSTNIHQIGFTPDGSVNYMVGFGGIEGGTAINAAVRAAGYHGPLPAQAGSDFTTFHVCKGTSVSTNAAAACEVASGADKNSIGGALVTFPTTVPDFVACKGNGVGTCTLSGTVCTANGSGATCTATGAAFVENSGRNRVSFSIGAIASIGGSSDDIWVMEENKTLRNVQDGTQ